MSTKKEIPFEVTVIMNADPSLTEEEAFAIYEEGKKVPYLEVIDDIDLEAIANDIDESELYAPDDEDEAEEN